MSSMYNAYVEVADRRDFTSDQIDAVVAQLEAFHVAVSTSQRGWRAAHISLPAESLAQACATAAAVVSTAYGAQAIACEVMTEKEFAAREGFEPVSDLVSVTEAAEILGISRQAVHDRIKVKSLPATKVGREYVIPRSAVAAG